MTEEENKWQQVENYLEGGMDASEKAAFEKALASDPHLAALVEASLLATEVVIGHEALKLKEQMAKDLATPKPNALLYILLPFFLIAVGTGAYFYSRSITENVPTSTIVVPESTLATETKSQEPTTPIQAEKPKVQSIVQAKTKGAPPVKKEELTPIPVPASGPANVSLPKETLPASAPVGGGKVSHVHSLPKETPNDKCAGLKIELQYSTQPTCANRNTGELHIKTESVKGGTAPYAFSLAADKEFTSNEIRNLKEGTYTLFVKDARECVVAYAKSIMVHKIVCEAPKEYSYNPAFDGAWKIPYNEDKKAVSVKIIDKGGREVYFSHVQDDSPTEWNGESNTGSAIGMGYHTFLIEYADGTVDKGAITILR